MKLGSRQLVAVAAAAFLAAGCTSSGSPAHGSGSGASTGVRAGSSVAGSAAPGSAGSAAPGSGGAGASSTAAPSAAGQPVAKPSIPDSCSTIAFADKWAAAARRASSIGDLQGALYTLREAIHNLLPVVPGSRLRGVVARLATALNALEAAGEASSTPAGYRSRVQASAALRADERTLETSMKTLDSWRAGHC